MPKPKKGPHVPSVVSPALFRSPKFLDQMAEYNFAGFQRRWPSEVRPLGLAAGSVVVMTWCSICSGSEVILFVLTAIAAAFKARGIKLIFKHLFSCEILPSKQEWIMGAFEEGNVEEGCLFERAEDLGQEYAQCVKHERKCRVPHAEVVIAGTSCKDLSRANPTNNKGKPCVLTQEFSQGGSAQTFRGLMLYLGRFQICLVFFENVDTLEEHDSANSGGHCKGLDIIRGAFYDVNLSSVAVLTDSQLHGLPQERRRYYIVATSTHSSKFFDFSQKPCKEVFDEFSVRMGLCERMPPCSLEILLDSGDPCIEKALNLRQVHCKKNDAPYSFGNVVKQYKDGVVRMDASFNSDEFWYPTLSKLQKSVLQFSMSERPVDTVCRDISQMCNRVRYSNLRASGHVAMCQMPAQLVWLEQPGQTARLLLGREALAIQGFPLGRVPSLVEKTPEQTLMSLAGNMMASTVLLACVQSFLSSVTWRQLAGTSSSPEDISVALTCFGVLTNAGAGGDEEEPSASGSAPRFKRRRASQSGM